MCRHQTESLSDPETLTKDPKVRKHGQLGRKGARHLASQRDRLRAETRVTEARLGTLQQFLDPQGFQSNRLPEPQDN